MLRTKLLIPILAILAIAGVSVKQMQPPAVNTARAETGRVVEVVYATGVVRPDSETKVASDVAGRIVALYADEGDVVGFGQVLARLDDSAARIRLQEAQRRLESAQARLRQVAAPTDPFTVRQIESQLRASQSRVAAARERAQSAEDKVQTAQAAARAAESSIQGALARAKALRNQARAARNEVEAVRERADAASAEVVQARANLQAALDLYRRRVQLLREGAIAERQVTEARTAYSAADAAVKAAEKRVHAAEQSVQAARATADAAEAQADDAAAAVETARANAAAAQSQVAEAKNAVSDLTRQAEAAQQDVEAVRSQLGQARRGARPVEVAVPRSEVETAQAAVAQAQRDLAYYTLRAPVAGRITERPVDVGDYVAAGSAPTGTSHLFTLANEQRIYVRADVDEADIGQVRLGAEARLQVDAEPGKTFAGSVALIGREADRSTKTYPVEIRNLRDTAGLRIGMTADVNIQGRMTPDAVLVPTAVLVTRAEGTAAWVVDSEGRARERRVRIKAKDANTVQILEGILPGETVILNPPGGLQEGQRVKASR